MFNRKLKRKNLLIKPNKGGIPANVKSKTIIAVVTKKKFPQIFNSFKVRKNFKSNKKKIPNKRITKNK